MPPQAHIGMHRQITQKNYASSTMYRIDGGIKMFPINSCHKSFKVVTSVSKPNKEPNPKSSVWDAKVTNWHFFVKSGNQNKILNFRNSAGTS